MTCKDCLHVEVCVWKYEQPNAEKCKGFKERSRYVVREKGEWKYYRKQGIAVCTSCSFERNVDDNFGMAVACPNCGADMTGGERNV